MKKSLRLRTIPGKYHLRICSKQVHLIKDKKEAFFTECLLFVILRYEKICRCHSAVAYCRSVHLFASGRNGGEVQIGCRVVVPFGRKKFYTAIVTNVHYAAPEGYETKDIEEVLDSTPVLLPKQFEFWEWLASYYLCTLGDVYKAAIPSGMKLESETLVVYNPDFEASASLPEKEQKILDLLSNDTEQCVTQLEKASGMKNILPAI